MKCDMRKDLKKYTSNKQEIAHLLLRIVSTDTTGFHTIAYAQFLYGIGWQKLDCPVAAQF